MLRLSQRGYEATADASGLTKALVLWMGLNVLDELLTFHLFGLGGAEGNPFL
jgi:hypothetical protein